MILRVAYRDIGEWGGISFFSHVSGDLPHDAFNELTDGHPRRNGMRVHDDVRGDAFHRPGHVLLCVGHAHSPLLTVPAAKLISNLRNPNRPHSHFHKPQAISISRQQYL